MVVDEASSLPDIAQDQTVRIDEKKFRLCGPDGYRYIYHRRDTQPPSQEVEAGSQLRSLMCIGGISKKYGMTELAIVKGSVNAVRYSRFLEENVAPYITGPAFIQHDNARIHTAHISKDTIEELDLGFVGQPPRSPEMQAMELVWAAMTHKVYEGGVFYDSEDELESRLQEVWKELQADRLFQSRIVRHTLDEAKDAFVKYRL